MYFVLPANLMVRMMYANMLYANLVYANLVYANLIRPAKLSLCMPSDLLLIRPVVLSKIYVQLVVFCQTFLNSSW